MQFKSILSSASVLSWIAAICGLASTIFDARILPVASAEEVNSKVTKDVAGLKATYSIHGANHIRIDADILFAGLVDSQGQWQADSRLPDGPFEVSWQGQLNIVEPGRYQFYFYGIGNFRLLLGKDQVLQLDSAKLGWHTSSVIELPRGLIDFQAEYRSYGEQSAAGLYWSSNLFQLEPIESQWFSCKGEQSHLSDSQSQLLARAFRCQACHDFEQLHVSTTEPSAISQRSLPGPSLIRVKDNINPEWIVGHLSAKPLEMSVESKAATTDSPASSEFVSDGRTMPYFFLSESEAEAIAAALLNVSVESKPATDWSKELVTLEKKRKAKDPQIRTKADVSAGEATFVSLGCIACHRAGELGKTALNHAVEDHFAGGDVARTNKKRPSAGVARWLDDPASVNPSHRMPRFDLSLHQRLDLHAWITQLSQQENGTGKKAEPKSANIDEVALGESLIRKHRCSACHELPESLQAKDARIAVRMSDEVWSRSCLTAGKTSQPKYQVSLEQSSGLRDYLTGNLYPIGSNDANLILAERNCLSCHRRAGEAGIFKHFAVLADDFPGLASKIPGMTPPALNGVGDKLHRHAIEQALGREPQRLRDWLDIRMPQFGLSDSEVKELTDYFISHDRIPIGAPRQSTESVEAKESKETNAHIDDQAYWLAAGRLVTPEGFSCQSCHQIADIKPAGIALNAHGTDLTMIGKRVREDWFYRWVKNPARIVPRMEMPAIQTAVVGVLSDSLDKQLQALWLTLNRPDFRPPKPNPVRILRSYNDGQPEFAQVLTDVIEVPAVITRPLAIGFPNRHNWLIDLENGSLKGWWLGDLARLHTRGKSWYWEPGAEQLLKNEWLETWAIEDPEQGRLQTSPLKMQQFAFELDQLQHIKRGIVFKGRLHFRSADSQSQQTLRVQQQWSWHDSQQTSTSFAVEGLVAKQKLVISPTGRVVGSNVVASEDQFEATRNIRTDFENGHRFEYALPSSQSQVAQNEIHLTRSPTNQSIKWSRTMRPALTSDSVKRVAVPNEERKPRQLDCVPGFEAIELPLPRTEMPISIAWDSRGKCFVGSLKGRVLELLDSNNDGLWDDYRRISDEIPTPYGICVSDRGLDVIAKFGLLRLTPSDDGDPSMDFKVVADGWGYTPDYHDWAVGLERDAQGNYYVTLPCQQDDRSVAAAKWRGHALKLVPTQGMSTKDLHLNEDREYRLESIASGLRFPMGVALNRAGDLFASDNQGNYTPFNELNHLHSGKHYGFVNKLENKSGFAPPVEPPAVNIPHPWMRSVNGICFLYSPLQHQNLFGPFEGHLIGCEMNGRCLVRMSLEKVGDQYQGAVYPFSLPIGTAKENFEGPIVCKVAPNGDLFIGNLHDSGWGGGNNTGSLVRLRPTSEWPLGIAEVRARNDGFQIALTQSVDRAAAENKSNYSIRSYVRIPTPAYGGDDQDEKVETIESVNYDPKLNLVTIQLEKLRQGAVYELNIKAIGSGGKDLFPNQCHYTMKAIP